MPLSPRNCGLFCVFVWHVLTIGGSVKHRFSMALKLMLSTDDTMMKADIMSPFSLIARYRN
ncbi:hypothetical protein CR159_04665 [Pollutimonas subterranea]|uniref:Uncharacterized protein n=1 Tax=Pollutimonas subterranea TaxID=2045210 RepID=A0A2N4U7A4_9BURK|nr:hypothetical protein CR159_04665 [Pollutimonas subterranea]